MSNWLNADFSDIPTGRELLPAADYTLEVVANTAKFGKFDPNALEFRAAVVGGEFNGKPVFVSYPSPEKQEWSLTAFKRLTVALGVDIVRGETPIDYLNRVGGLRFVMPITIVKDKEDVDRQRVNILNPKPAKN